MTEAYLPASMAKRSRSSDSRASTNRTSEVSDTENLSEQKKQKNLGVPAFLNQSPAELRGKFEELEWIQRSRVAAGILADDPSHRWALETSLEVKSRNRYMNVQAWANSRVHLKVPEGECDFINASPIVMRDSKTGQEYKYIATQGPKEGQLADFWNMVYHETGDVAVIVMLTQTFESGKEKCAQYFPVDMENPTYEFSSARYDPFVQVDVPPPEYNFSGSISLLESSYDEKLRSNISKLELRAGSRVKIVWHFLFAGWTDYSRPEGDDQDALLELTKSTAERASSPSNPRIVHCSAGVGRTGTFIALDSLLRELKFGNLLDAPDITNDAVFDTVNQLREQRMMMVYNEIQYKYIYEVLKEQARAMLGFLPVESRPQKIAKSSDEASKPELVLETTSTASTQPDG